MGLSIHYHGRLTKASTLQNIIEEVTDIARAENWNYFVFTEQFINNSFSNDIDNENLYGIMISPPGSEPLCFSFLSNGKMCGILNFKVFQLDNSIDQNELYSLATKTQYAGSEIHKKIVLLLDYISSNYLSDFECVDEGQFWETRNEKVLEETFDKYTRLISGFEDAFAIFPMLNQESIEDYCIRIAAITNMKENEMENKNYDDDELPKLNIEQENEFKKLKLSIEHGATFFDTPNPNLPPEIEGKFLDYVSSFENAFKNVKQIMVYEKLGKPEFKPANMMTDLEIIKELEALMELMYHKNIALDVLCEYEHQDRLLYTFIIEELFLHEVDDMNVPGMVTHFVYEEFHPNHPCDLKNATEDFLKMFLDKKSKLYKKYNSKDALNHEALNSFRFLFKKFKLIFFEILNLDFNETAAIVNFNIDFWAKIKGTDSKIYYSGKGSMTFEHKHGYWYVQVLELPIND